LVDPLPLEITCVEDIDKDPQPNAKREAAPPIISEATQGLSEYGKGEVPVVGLFEGPFTATCRGIEAELERIIGCIILIGTFSDPLMKEYGRKVADAVRLISRNLGADTDLVYKGEREGGV